MKQFFLNKNRQKKRGFTLVETIIVITATTLVMGAIVSSVIYFYQINDYAIEQAFVITSARRGISSMVRDIRESTYSDNGAYPVVEMGSTTLTIYSDVDRDERVERIRYFLEDGLFKRGSIQSSGSPFEYNPDDEGVQILADHVRNAELGEPIFEYFARDGSPMTDFTEVRELGYVQVNLVLNINPARLPRDFTLRSSAALRNIVNDN